MQGWTRDPGPPAVCLGRRAPALSLQGQRRTSSSRTRRSSSFKRARISSKGAPVTWAQIDSTSEPIVRPVSRPVGVYVHVPFCSAKCHYCDFNSFAGLDRLFGSYVEAVCREIGDLPQRRPPDLAPT